MNKQHVGYWFSGMLLAIVLLAWPACSAYPANGQGPQLNITQIGKFHMGYDNSLYKYYDPEENAICYIFTQSYGYALSCIPRSAK